jgi:glutamate dehydrogenase (NAD(P)+)
MSTSQALAPHSPVVVHAIVAPELGLDGFIAVAGENTPLAFGGLRVSPTVTPQMVADLAQVMKFKYASHGIPIGGAKGGIRCHSEHAHRPEVIRAFAEQARPLLDRNVILGKDLGASDELLDAMYAALDMPQLELVCRRHEHSPRRIRDLSGYRRHMTGLGVAWSVESTLEALDIEPRGARLLVQGFGRVGAGTAVHLVDQGLSLVGVSDREGAILHPEGLPLDALMAATDKDGTVDRSRCDFPFEAAPRDALLTRPGDVLVLAADSYCLDASLAAGVSAKIVAEGANFGMTADSHLILHDRGCLVVPDVIASSSSAALVGHQLASGNTLDPAPLWARIERCIRANVSAAIAESRRTGKTPRQGFIDVLEATC